MKKTVKTSRVAGQLEKMYRLLNIRFFNGELPEVVISLKKTVGACGHFTCSKVWQAGDERRYEINISSATLSRAIEDTCSTLLHEMCHCFAAEKVSRTPAVPETFTTIGSIRRLPKATGFALRSTQNTDGRLQAPDFLCWTSSRNRAGKTFRCARLSACGM